MKFGGTSVGSAERMRATARIISEAPKPVVAVLSAMSGITNKLIDLAAGRGDSDDIMRRHAETASQLGVEHAAGELNRILSSARTEAETVACGELMSTTLMTAFMQASGLDSVLVPALDFMRVNEHGEPDTKAIRELAAHAVESAGKHEIY
ncbi:MAG: hypothetical protein K2F72_02340, partial [Muribaculaceae bacterium]|nr:hypothetical protein [Muribaculaceae bacterium]